MTAAVIVVGSYNQDLVWRTARFPGDGETGTGRFRQGPGGKGFNQAMAAHRLDAGVCFFAARGDDALGETASELATSEGLPCRWQILPGEATGNAAIWLDDNGQNRILVDLAANRLLSAAHIETHTAEFDTARVLLVQQEAASAASEAALRRVKAAGGHCILNPAPADADCAALLALTDVLTPNETEFAALLQADGDAPDAGAIAHLGAAELHALARRLPCTAVIITLGARGALLCQNGNYREFPPPPVTVRDTTGAGDCFNGALAAELARGLALADACAFAMKAAACKVERAGAALAMPTRADILRRFPD